MAVKRYWEGYLDARWQFFKFCTCGGTPKYKYNGPNNLQLHVLSAKAVFRLFENGRPKTGGKIEDMKAVLEGL